eukprot:Skav236150  [mRNA]  locus=scaffold2146:256067:256612:- [translate_table: standard]
MSNPSEPKVSEELAKAAQQILTHFHRQNQAQGEVAGAMHDGCKRGREWSDGEMWCHVNYDENLDVDRFDAGATTSTQTPVVPTRDPKKVILPEGVESIEDWGTTVCRMPKVASLGASYEELVQMPKWHEYLKWVVDHGHGQGGRLEDFAKYLTAIDFPKIMQKMNPHFGKSKEVRERKPRQ